jgi:hypothetical protein
MGFCEFFAEIRTDPYVAGMGEGEGVIDGVALGLGVMTGAVGEGSGVGVGVGVGVGHGRMRFSQEKIFVAGRPRPARSSAQRARHFSRSGGPAETSFEPGKTR